MYDPAAPGRVQDAKPDDVLEEARERYERAADAASDNRQRYRDAIRFVGGDQWDEQTRRLREANRRPCLTMDRLGSHINQVVNDQRQSKPAIKVHPVDDTADVDTAEVFNGVIRNIEHLSNAPMVYETAAWTQVAGGQGVWRILTEYCDEASFDQDILLRRVLDPMSVTFDPDAKEQDASDGRFCFIEQTLSKEQFEKAHPDVRVQDWPSQTDPQGWWTADSVRLAEYYRIVERPTTLYMLADGSTMDAESLAEAQQGGQPIVTVGERPAKRREVQWFLLGGGSVIDSRIWPGKWIPVVRVVGNEMMIDGKVIYTGITHRAMDPARVYNYQASVVVEMLSLQKTAPWIGAKGQFSGMEQRWATANFNNPAYLEYEPVTIEGNLAPPPQRQSPPTVPTGNVQAMQLAAEDLQWITGQHAASFGAKSNETSGRAIMARQREGDGATYHYLDNLSRSILHTGRILVDLIPKVYDTRKVLRVIGEDGSAKIVPQNPTMPAASAQMPSESGVQQIYNLGVGRYDVAVAVGPSFGTKRMEAVEAMTTLLQGNPQLWQAIGDLYLRNQDWPGALEMSERLKKMVPPELRGDEENNDPQAQMAQMQGAMQQAQQAIQQREAALQQASEMLEGMQKELQQLKEQQAQAQDKTQAEMLRAETERYKADADVRIAELEAQTEVLKAQNEGESAEIEQLKQAVAMLAQRKEEPEDGEGPSMETQLLAQIYEGQQAFAASVQALAETIANKPPTVVEVQRDTTGRAVRYVERT